METTSLNAGMVTSLEILTIQVVAGDGPDLMGRERLSHSDIINLGEVYHITKPLHDILDKQALCVCGIACS